MHFATWESSVYGFAHRSELQSLRQKLFPDRLPRFTPKLKRRYGQPFLTFFFYFYFSGILMIMMILSSSSYSWE